jgi:glycosyltransferase involved in cell wall biosynthesis
MKTEKVHPRRVLHVLHSLERSGMETMLACSYEEWQKAGYQCDIVATAASEGPLADTLRAAGYGVFHVPFRGRFWYLPHRHFFSRFYALCGSGYDIVHIHVEASALLCAGIAKAAGVQGIALTPHGMFRFHGLLRARKFVERCIVRCMGGRYGMISDSVQACEWERYRNPGPRIFNWMNTKHFFPPSAEQRAEARAALEFRSDDFLLASVGNCSSIKNHTELLRALAQVKQHPWTYLHAGQELAGEPERALAAELGIADRIRFLGSLAHTRPILWAADAFVMTSLHEGLGLAGLEAIACGLPAVLTDVSGLRDVAAIAGAAIQVGTNADSIAEGLRTLFAMSDEERSSLFAGGSARVRAGFSIEKGVHSIVSGIYDDAPLELLQRDGVPA